MGFLCFGEFQKLCIRVLACDKFVNVSRMIPSPPFISLYKFLTFGQLSCILRKVEVTCATGLYWLVLELMRVGMLCLIPVEIVCTKGTSPRLKADKVGKACLYENGNVPFMPLMDLFLVQCSKSENKAFIH